MLHLLKQKKGYVLLETLVVVGILTIVLVGMYSSFINMYSKFREQRNYDNTEYLYKTKVLREQLNLTPDFNSQKIITICNNLDENKICENDSEYGSVFKELDVQYAFFAHKNITTGDVYNLSNVPVTIKRYIRDLDTKASDEDVILIVAYKSENPGYEIASINYSKTDTDLLSYFEKLTSGLDSGSSSLITKAAPTGATCTNTLAFDGTGDNNLRYVGANPCNYVSFNEETPTFTEQWGIVDLSNGTVLYSYDSESTCQSNYMMYGSPSGFACQKRTLVTGGWRIIGIMNHVDDGTGKKETRIKLIRNDSLGNYSWDSSDSTVNSGWGINDWTQADLMKELNGDYLNNNLTANTYWYNGQNNQKTEIFDYTKRLSLHTQNIIGNAKWYLGGNNNEYSTASEFYIAERKNNVWGSTSGQTCNDGACPRATSWTGKVALAYPSDYGFAIGGTVRDACLEKMLFDYTSNDCYSNQWLPSSVLLTSSSSSKYKTSFLNSTGNIFFDRVIRNETVVPVVYLKSWVRITGGQGTPENPYTLGL